MAAACKDILVKLRIVEYDKAMFSTLANDWDAHTCAKQLEGGTVQLQDLQQLNKSHCKEILWMSLAACKNLESRLCDATAVMLSHNRCDEVLATL